MPDLLGSSGVDSMIALHSDPAPALSQFALQSYYTSVLRNSTSTRGGLLSGLGAPNEATATVTQSESGADDDPARSATSKGHSAFDHRLSTVYHRGRVAEGTGARPAPGAGADDDLSEGDSTDHVQQWQHGNTKKRKVPANMGARAAGRERSLSLGGSEEEEEDTATTMMVGFAGRQRAGHNDNDIDSVLAAAPPLLSSLPPAQVLPRKGKISPSALAGLRHKELLRQRKRQLAAMLGALSLGDTFALDQALSTHIPFVSTTRSGPDSDVRKVRLSRRRGPRLARAARAQMTSPDNGASFPAAQFRFAYPSATSERLLATEEDMLALRKRFEAELARQAAKAAKAAAEAKQAALAVGTKTPRPKRSGKGQPRTRTTGDTPVEPKSRGTKKKKSTNVTPDPYDRHRLSAPVPSYSSQNTLNHPLLFLSANIPRKRKKATTAATPTAQMVDPAEEWICPHCEYSLFYSDGPEYKRAIRNRKKILRRRRRAQERAAGGLSAPKIPPAKDHEDEEDGYGDEGGLPGIPKSTEWKQGTSDIKGVNGQHHLESG